MRNAVWALLVVGCSSPAKPKSEHPIVTATPDAAVTTLVEPPKPKADPPIEIAKDPPASGDIGTAKTLWVIATAPSGSWVLACDVRKDTDKNKKLDITWGHHGELFGDDPAPYLIKGDGLGEELDAFAGIDPKHRYIAIAHAKSIEILDTESGTKTELKGADLEYENGHFQGARVAFDRDGKYVLFTRTAKRKTKKDYPISTIIVHALADGVEHEIKVDRGLLQSVRIEGGIVVADVYDPTPGSMFGASVGNSGPPHTEGARRCRVDHPNPPPENGTDRYALLATAGTVKAEKDVVVTLANGFVREHEGALTFDHDGTSEVIADAACKGVVLDGSHEFASLLYVCADKNLRYWRAGASKSLGIPIEEPKPVRDHFAYRNVAIASAGDRMIDLGTGAVHEEKDHYAIAGWKSSVLLHRREGSFVVYDFAKDRRIELPTLPPDMMIEAQQGRIFAAGQRPESETPLGLAVDIESAAELGQFAGEAQAVSDTGWVLTHERDKPLRWVRPVPATAAKK